MGRRYAVPAPRAGSPACARALANTGGRLGSGYANCTEAFPPAELRAWAGPTKASPDDRKTLLAVGAHCCPVVDGWGACDGRGGCYARYLGCDLTRSD